MFILQGNISYNRNPEATTFKRYIFEMGSCMEDLILFNSGCKEKNTIVEETDETEEQQKGHGSNTKPYKCTKCNKTLYLTSVDILKHKKSCR